MTKTDWTLEGVLRYLWWHLEPERRIYPPAHHRNARLFYRTPRIVCANGFSLSVQAAEFNYCSPRDNDGPWTQVEVGFPSARVEKLMPYVEDADTPCHTVYAYVPIEVVAQVIIDNGGPAGETDLHRSK